MNEDGTSDSTRERRDTLTVTGRVDARPFVVGRAAKAAWLCRMAYNAVVDRHVPFMEGFVYRYETAKARRDGRKAPEEPTRSARFLPVPDMKDVQPAVATLRSRYPEMADFAYSTQWEAADDGCKAVSAHVRRCVDAKANGLPLPKLRFRSAGDPMDVVTDAFRIVRSGDGAGHTKPKTGKRVTSKTLKNRRRRAAKKLRRDVSFRAEKLRLGWTEGRIAYGLGVKAERAGRDRERNAAKAKEARPAGRARSDSPKATVGERVVDLEVKGIGRMRVRLDRELPEDAKVVQVHMVKKPGKTSRLEVRFVLSIPRAKPLYDELETGALIHAAVRHLPADASPEDAVLAVRAATDLKVVGEDLGLVKATTDDSARTTRLRKISMRELRGMAERQRALAWKDQCAKKAAEARGETSRPRRSNEAKKLQAKVDDAYRKVRNRQRTAALTDAKELVKDRRFVATDPLRMVGPLLAKGGPAERRKARLEGRPLPLPPVVGRRVDGSLVFLDPARQRSMRRNGYSLSPSTRIRRVTFLCERVGAIHATPGHEGTTAGCPRCRSTRKKGLGEREHHCGACGLRMPRDQASALFTLGMALLEYREGPDPGGRVAARREKQAKAEAKADGNHERRVAAGKKGGAVRGAARKAGADALASTGRVALGRRDPKTEGHPARGLRSRGGTSGGASVVLAHAASN